MLSTYNQDVGSTSMSEQNAAARARDETDMLMGVVDYNSPVGADLRTLSGDFESLYSYALGEDSTDYDAASATTNVDARQLEKDCKDGL